MAVGMLQVTRQCHRGAGGGPGVSELGRGIVWVSGQGKGADWGAERVWGGGVHWRSRNTLEAFWPTKPKLFSDMQGHAWWVWVGLGFGFFLLVQNDNLKCVCNLPRIDNVSRGETVLGVVRRMWVWTHVLCSAFSSPPFPLLLSLSGFFWVGFGFGLPPDIWVGFFCRWRPDRCLGCVGSLGLGPEC